MKSPERAKTYRKDEWSAKPQAVRKRLWYHGLSSEQKEQFLRLSREYQRNKRAELTPEQLEQRRKRRMERYWNEKNNTPAKQFVDWILE
jgi:hypothetical protein